MSGPKVLPKYPIYVPSKGRCDHGQTMRFLVRDGVAFFLVVEPGERSVYEAKYGNEPLITILELDKDGSGLLYARNWIMSHSIAAGDERHWQLDDNIDLIRRFTNRVRIPCEAGIALRCAEDFSDRYTNVALTGLNYEMFAISTEPLPPFYLNMRVYSCSLVNNSIPHRWRIYYNDDTDLCLQVLVDGWCTILINAFMATKMRTMSVKGGNTDDLYQGDGRALMSRTLERIWPGVVETKRRFGRPQHVVKHQWRKFDNKLIRRDGVVIPPKGTWNEYGMELRQVRPLKPGRKLLVDKLPGKPGTPQF